MTRSETRLDVPIGRVELLGQVLHIVEHDGRLVAVCHDEHGMPVEALVSQRLDGHGCRNLMREAVDLLIQAADISLLLTAFATNGRRGAAQERNSVADVRAGPLRISPATAELRPES